MSIASDMQADWLNTVLRNHIAIVQGALQVLGLLVGVVGAFTLSSAICCSGSHSGVISFGAKPFNARMKALRVPSRPL